MSEDHAYDPLVLQACLDINQDEKSACIGVAAARCMYGAGRGSTENAVNCMTAELSQWGEMLNEVSAELEDREGDLEAQSQSMAAGTPRPAVSVADIQREWTEYRDVRCSHEAAEWSDSPQAQVAMANCWMQLTGEHALKLQERLLRETGE